MSQSGLIVAIDPELTPPRYLGAEAPLALTPHSERSAAIELRDDRLAAPSLGALQTERTGELLAAATAGAWMREHRVHPRIITARAGARLTLSFALEPGQGPRDVLAGLRAVVDELGDLVERDEKPNSAA